MSEQNGLAGYLALTLFMGAARKDANPQQLERLRAEVIPMIKDFRDGASPKAMLDKTVEIMGVDWKIPEDFHRAIINLTSPS